MTDPGIYDDVDELVYHAGTDEPSLSVSGAKKLLDSPARFKWEQDNPPRKKVFDFGHAAHAKVLGVGLEVVTVPPDLCAKNGAWSTAEAKAFVAEAEAAGGVVLKPSEIEVVDAMALALESNRDAMRLLKDGTPEQSIYWRDDETKVLLRSRADWVTALGDQPVIVDYKTCSSANPDEFRWEAGKYGYPQQDDWYREGYEILTGTPHGFVFIAQEKTAPYLSSVVELDDEAREIGRQRNGVARRLFLDCMTRDEWPAYPGVHRVSVPNIRPAKEYVHV
ncbi:PD-(D/E)XK nuclease-like domain-containing protein [Janibacter terrae]|uniref:PD-(D/E)XK nuclease-like domain-containing protein n=1 Tax=Janibacter terrae TaxID=103817 RepID=UPI0031F790FF